MGTKNLNSATDLITFSRASGGTALRKISYGSELVTNGTFDTTSGWNGIAATTDARWYIDSGRLTKGGTNGTVSQIVNPLVAGKSYKVEVDVIARPVGNVVIRLGDADYTITSTLGTQSAVFSPTDASNGIRIFTGGAGGGGVILDNISVKEVLYDQPDGTLQLFNSPANVPRIEYNADGTVKGLLIEEARTNNVANSESCLFVGLSGGTATTSTTPAPYNLTSVVQRVQASVINTGAKLSVQVLTSGDNSTSVYVRSRTGTDQNFKITTSGSTGATLVAPASGEWVRKSRVSSLGAGGRDMRVLSTGDTIDLDIALPQLEAGAFPTSYIPTTGSTATRAADVASIPTANFGYNSDAGSIVAEVLHFTTESGAAASGFAFDDGSANNRMYYYQNKGQWIGSVSGSTTFNIDTADPLENSDTKVGTGYKKDNVSLVVNSSIIGNDTSTDIPSVNKFYFGSTSVGTYLNGHIKSIKYYPRRLTNAQLQELTT